MNYVDNASRGKIISSIPTHDQKELEMKNLLLEKILNEKESELKRSEKLAIIGQISSRIAHDVRSPLGVAQSGLDLLLINNRKNFSQKDLEIVDRIYRALDRIGHQVNDVMDFVRVSAPQLEKVSLNFIINNVVERTQIPDSVSLIRPNPDLQILCDPIKMEAVLANLILNSVQAMEGEGKVVIIAQELADSYLISIEDTGPGIPQEIMNKIFEPLFTTKKTGTGLGLVTCKSIVEKHGGSISVKSNPTLFEIKLPKKKQD